MPRTRKKNVLQLYCKFEKKKQNKNKKQNKKQNKKITFTYIMVYSIASFSVSGLSESKSSHAKQLSEDRLVSCTSVVFKIIIKASSMTKLAVVDKRKSIFN